MPVVFAAPLMSMTIPPHAGDDWIDLPHREKVRVARSFSAPSPVIQSSGKIGRVIFRYGSERRLLVQGPGVSTHSILVEMGS